MAFLEGLFAVFGAAPPAGLPAAAPPPAETEKKMGEIQLPPAVLEELRRLGMALGSYSIGQLESARLACVIDCRLIDDPLGDNFEDQLELTEDEVDGEEGNTPALPYCVGYPEWPSRAKPEKIAS